jgi:multidrug efflux pump subunit AcrA (membrane-fusion protein)
MLKHGIHELELRFARARDLQDPRVGSLFILFGRVFVQTILPEPAPPPAASGPGSAAPLEFDDITELFIAHLADPVRELLVRDGERVRKGQLLARLGRRDQELERRRQHAEAQLQEKRAGLALQEGKARQARALVGAGLAAAGAIERGEAQLLRAREAVEPSSRELVRLAEEAARLSAIRSPVDGQVLTVHVIHGSEGTAVLRLLYRKGREGNRR